MSGLEQKVYLSQLFAIYGDLLTKKQQQYFELTFNEDWSLQEIAEEFNVSRNAVLDSNKRSEELLINFETKLQILNKRIALKTIIDEYELNDNQQVQELIKKIKGVF